MQKQSASVTLSARSMGGSLGKVRFFALTSVHYTGSRPRFGGFLAFRVALVEREWHPVSKTEKIKKGVAMSRPRGTANSLVAVVDYVESSFDALLLRLVLLVLLLLIPVSLQIEP